MSNAGQAEGRLNILFLCNRTGRNVDAATVTDHLDSFGKYSRHRIQELSFLRELPAALDLEQFDVLVIHYTIAIGWLSEHYLSEKSKQKIRAFSGLKGLFIQDEYRAVNALHASLRRLKMDILFTCVPESELEKVYPADALPGVAKISNLTGYVPEGLVEFKARPISDRPIDVGYRTRKPPYWLGELAYEKWRIAERFKELAGGAGLTLNLSYQESERLYGPAWTQFVSSCKAMLGVESGSSVFDFTGDLQRTVEDYVEKHPDATFDDVQRKFLMPYEGRIRYNQISPRSFEAAALRTVMILHEGEYSGVLKPERHYVPLRKDFSNLAEVLAILRDPGKLQKIADTAFEEIACNEAYSYRSFILRFDQTVEREFFARGIRRSKIPFSRQKYVGELARSPSYVAHRVYSPVFQWLLLGPSRRRGMMNLWYSIPHGFREFVRPLLRWVLGR